jgi:hypothetical protein
MRCEQILNSPFHQDRRGVSERARGILRHDAAAAMFQRLISSRAPHFGLTEEMLITA